MVRLQTLVTCSLLDELHQLRLLKKYLGKKVDGSLGTEDGGSRDCAKYVSQETGRNEETLQTIFCQYERADRIYY